jgi:hypothetical protein
MSGGFHLSIGGLPGFPHGTPHPAGIPAYRPTQGGPQPYCPPVQTGSIFGATTPAVMQAPPYSNTVKCFTNWNVCYSCGFDVAEGDTSMTCLYHLRIPSHDVNLSRQNSQQYIDMGHPCSMHNHHKLPCYQVYDR